MLWNALRRIQCQSQPKSSLSRLPSRAVSLFVLAILVTAHRVHGQIYLEYAESDTKPWSGACNATQCTQSLPCTFTSANTGYYLQNITSSGCLFVITVSSGVTTSPVLTIDASQVTPTLTPNLTLFLASPTIEWSSLVITTSVPVYFRPATTDTAYSMGGNATFQVPASALATFASSRSYTFLAINLFNPRFRFVALAPNATDNFASTTTATISALLYACTVNTTDNFVGTNFAFDTSAITTITGTATVLTPATIDMLFEVQATNLTLSSSTDHESSYHASFLSYGSSATAHPNWTSAIVTGKAYGLFQILAADGQSSGPYLSFTSTTTKFSTDTDVLALVEVIGFNSTEAHLQWNCDGSNATLSPVSSTRTVFSNGGTSQLYLSSSTVTGLSLQSVLTIQTSGSQFVNCEIITSRSVISTWNVIGDNAIAYLDSTTPSQSSTGGMTVSSISNVNFVFDSSATIRFLSASTLPNIYGSYYIFSNVNFTLESTSQSSDCVVYFDTAVVLAPGAITTQCNFSSELGVNGTSSSTASTLSAASGTYGLYGPSLDVATGILNTIVNVSNFRSMHITPTVNAQPLLSTVGLGSIVGLPRDGVVVDWQTTIQIQPANNTAYLAFNTTSSAITSLSQSNGLTSDATVTDFIVSYVPANDGASTVSVWLMTGALTPEASPVTPPTTTTPPTSPPSPTSPPTTSSTPSSTCTGTSPGSGFYCSDGVWVSNGTVTTTTVTITTTSVIVNGNLTAQTVTFSGSVHNVTVTGCVTIDGITIDLSTTDPNTLAGKTVGLISQGSNCTTSLTSIPVSITQSKSSCASVSSSTSSTSTQSSLSVLFSVDKSSCNTKWIIIGCVVGAVVLLAVVGIIVFVTVRKNMKTSKAKSDLRQAAI